MNGLLPKGTPFHSVYLSNAILLSTSLHVLPSLSILLSGPVAEHSEGFP